VSNIGQSIPDDNLILSPESIDEKNVMKVPPIAVSRGRVYYFLPPCTSHPMGKLEQCALICFFTLKGLRLQQIQTELNGRYHKRVFQLPAVEKWYLRFANRTRDLEDEPDLQLKVSDFF
jgi:hypothetical protein